MEINDKGFCISSFNGEERRRFFPWKQSSLLDWMVKVVTTISKALVSVLSQKQVVEHLSEGGMSLFQSVTVWQADTNDAAL